MATCYWVVNGTDLVSQEDQKICGPSTSKAQFCCTPGDTCLEDSICHYTHPEVGGSGYYVGGCTDPSFPEPCSKSCTDFARRDIVYNASTSLWACCYQHLGGSLDCSNPGDETFYAPSPESLTIQATSSSTSSSSATSSTNNSIAPSSTPSASASTSSTSSVTLPASILSSSATTTHAPSSALSAGDKAGIGVAASIAGLGVILLLGFFLLGKRRRQQYQEAFINRSKGMTSASTSEQRHAVEKYSEQRWELDGNARSEIEASWSAIR